MYMPAFVFVFSRTNANVHVPLSAAFSCFALGEEKKKTVSVLANLHIIKINLKNYVPEVACKLIT